jgi:PTH1 family peptidyl-tRNA hydrolase
LRLRPRGGDGGHLGLRDVIARLGTHEVPRLRFGIGRSPDVPDTVTHVLQEFSSSESQVVEQAVERACAAVECFLREGIVPTMDRFNVAPPTPAEDEGS